MRWKQWIGLFMLGVFLLNVFFHVILSLVIITHRQYVLCELMEEWEEEKSDHWVRIAQKEVVNAHWLDDKEFEWKGEMYDVVKTETTLQGTVLVCKKDSFEESLRKQHAKSTQDTLQKLLSGFFKHTFSRFPVYVGFYPPVLLSNIPILKISLSILFTGYSVFHPPKLVLHT